MACFCETCGRNTPSEPGSPVGLINNPFPSENLEPNRRATLAAALRNRIQSFRSKIIEVNTSLPAVFYDRYEFVYDMSGDKFLYIFCNENYMDNGHYNFRRPPSRVGSRAYAELLAETFEKIGFRCIIYDDMESEQIIDVISRVSQQDHSRTSCLWFTMMTHGTSTDLFAADRPIRRSEIEVLLRSEKLAGIPKVLLLPCNWGGNERAGFITTLSPEPPQEESELCGLSCNAVVDFWYDCVDWIHQCCNQGFEAECTDCPVCVAKNVDSGNTVKCASGNSIVQPSTSDFIFLYAATHDLQSINNLIQAICDTFKEHLELDYDNLILFVNQKFRGNSATAVGTIFPINDVTLTKTLRFTRIEAQAHCN